ncbi:type VI secretion system-associated FHA domain protein TagH [Uliginosibacterium gangwonense]|uniref:type VI secretion system-associated FHA domain protein TagH n=1 Tax=Uliginosibacterium gangwonense TaxID=392736 RepID=UPI000374B1DF|nr:type VI secretion system-associated FHA domain protein TagH [Uliginosibacterium gangwonense]
MLRVSVLTYKGISIIESLVMELDGQAGAIGRDAANQLVLPDPDRHLSRVQGVIRYMGGEYLLFDQGGNPSTVNGRPLGKGHSALLADGDMIGMAEYQLQVSLPHRSQVAAMSKPHTATPPVSDVAPTHALPASTLPTPVAVVLPQIAVPPTPEVRLPQPTPAALDELELEFEFTPLENAELMPLASERAASLSALVAGQPAERAPVNQAPASDINTQVLLEAFLKGLNVPGLNVAGGMTPALMEQIGVSFGEAVRGTVQLLMTRAAMKRNVHAVATVVVSRNNNPLKLCPDANFALSQMFAPQAPERFMGPVESMQDAYDDIKAHQLGVVAGMHAALDGLLARFQPQALENNLSAKSLFDSVMPANRKAKLWDAYEQHFEQISSEAEEDFHALFGEEFLRAYEEQVERLAEEAQARRKPS